MQALIRYLLEPASQERTKTAGLTLTKGSDNWQ